MMNDINRHHLIAGVIDRRPLHGPPPADSATQALRDRRIEHKQYIAEYGEDIPEIRQWKWNVSRRLVRGAHA
jgi:xylulose-5-phosphate/fructose-6-phosphate phosphoketolase